MAVEDDGRQLSEAESLMWRAEEDPWLSSSVGVVSALDRPVDFDRLRRRMAAGVVASPLLHSRIVTEFGRIGPMRWEPDPEFDLDHHLRRVGLARPGGERELLDLATRIVDDPFDRTRPLWQLWVIDGLRGGRSGLVWKLHHAVSDGLGAVNLAQHFLDLEPAPENEPQLDPDVLRPPRTGPSSLSPSDLVGDVSSALSETVKRVSRQLGGEKASLARRVAAEVLLVGADPSRLRETGVGVIADLQGLVEQANLGGRAGSAAWGSRSRLRRLEMLRFKSDRFKATARQLGGTVNDLFVSCVVHAAAEWHHERGEPLEHLSVSFIVSTRAPDAAGHSGGNAFVPVRVEVPVAGGALERFVATQAALARHRQGARSDGIFGALTGMAALLPMSVVTRVVRSQAAGLDVATSCLRTLECPLYVAGARTLWSVPIGPLAGTPANITALTYDREIIVGLNCDPIAIGDAQGLRDAFAAAYRTFESLG